MTSRAFLGLLLATVLLSAGSRAEQTGASEPVERLACEDVFTGDEVSAHYRDRIIGFAFGDAGRPEGRLSKWTAGLRILLRAEAAPQDFVLETVQSFRAALLHAEHFDPVAQFDWNDRAKVKDGDLVVFLTWRRGVPREVAGQRFDALIEAVRGPEPSAQIEPVLGAVDDPPFVGIVRSAEGAIRRAILVMDLNYAQLGGQPAIFQFLTTALNPNAGNVIYPGLPGSTPAEKRIYEKTWRSSVKYDLGWTREFQIYLRVLLQDAITPGMNAAQFSAATAQILNEPEMKQRVARLYDCELGGK